MHTQAHERPKLLEVVEPLPTTNSQEILKMDLVKQLKCKVGDQRSDSDN